MGCSMASHMLAVGASAATTTALLEAFAIMCSSADMNASVPALVELVWSVQNAVPGMPTDTSTVPERSFSTYGAEVDARANRVTFSGASGTDSRALLVTFEAAV